jgi:hypothetical protein
MEEQVFVYLFRRGLCWIRRRKYKFMAFWKRFRWCLIGGFAYAAGRFLFMYLKDLI